MYVSIWDGKCNIQINIFQDVTEGIVKLWRPKVNAKKFITFIENVKQNPNKYLNDADNTATLKIGHKDNTKVSETDVPDKVDVESQYQTVTHRRKEESTQTHNRMSSVEELIRRIVPAKSFLYRNQQKTERSPSYLPMDSGTPKKKKLFSLSSYEYPFFDIRARFSRQESTSDRGYYSMKRNSRYYIARTYRKPESKPKYKSLSVGEEISEKLPEDHFYEDLCYNEVVEKEKEKSVETRVVSVKPCIVKIQEYFQSFKVPFFKKHEMLEDCKVESAKEEGSNFYENSDSVANMYDSVHAVRPVDSSGDKNQVRFSLFEILNLFYGLTIPVYA